MTRRHEFLTELVEVLASVGGCDPVELEYTLYDHVETKALLSLATSDHTGWELRFEMPDHTVTVGADGQILVDGVVRRELDLPSTMV